MWGPARAKHTCISTERSVSRYVECRARTDGWRLPAAKVRVPNVQFGYDPWPTIAQASHQPAMSKFLLIQQTPPERAALVAKAR